MLTLTFDLNWPNLFSKLYYNQLKGSNNIGELDASSLKGLLYTRNESLMTNTNADMQTNKRAKRHCHVIGRGVK